MSYQALARKYRPQRFVDVVGQEPVIRTLTNALASGRVHHAYVLSGIRGVGKTTTARLLAKALNCGSGPTTDSCGTCASCVEVALGRSLDAIEIDAASNRGIDEIKGLIQTAQYSPSRDRFKVFIVDEFHMLTREAFNALLKTLEEPPAHVVFILATTELEKVPATILSRCLLLTFRPVGSAVVRDHLREIATREGVSLEPAAADLIVRKAGGSLRDAQSCLDRIIALAGTTITREAVEAVLGVVDARVLRQYMAAVLDGRAGDALLVVDGIARGGGDLHAFLEDLQAQARALLLVKVLPDPASVLDLSEEDVAALREVVAASSADDLQRCLDRLIDAAPRLRLASEPRYFLEALTVRLAGLVRLEPLVDLLAHLRSGGAGSPPSRAEPAAAAPPAPAVTSSVTPSVTRCIAPPQAPPKAAAPEPAPAPPPARPSWRDRVASSTPEPVEPDGDPIGASRRAPVPRRPPVRGADPLEAFRSGLPARLRGHVDQGLVRREGDGIAVLFPSDEAAHGRQFEESRFHLVAAAAEAFGRPVPVRIAIEEGLLQAPLAPGDVPGLEFETRRLKAQAETSDSVRAVLERFEGRVTAVDPIRGD